MLSALLVAAKFTQDIITEVLFSSQKILSRSECPGAGRNQIVYQQSIEAPSSSQKTNSRRECPGAAHLSVDCNASTSALANMHVSSYPALMLCTAMARFCHCSTCRCHFGASLQTLQDKIACGHDSFGVCLLLGSYGWPKSASVFVCTCSLSHEVSVMVSRPRIARARWDVLAAITFDAISGSMEYQGRES